MFALDSTGLIAIGVIAIVIVGLAVGITALITVVSKRVRKD
ncbi:hypothetical protein [Myceligenerans salitolerans]|nr:hypothetical protein [Myceligenerans salitolerans]